MPLAIDRAIAFVDRNTRHPMRIVGLNRVRLDEVALPPEAINQTLDEALAEQEGDVDADSRWAPGVVRMVWTRCPAGGRVGYRATCPCGEDG